MLAIFCVGKKEVRFCRMVFSADGLTSNRSIHNHFDEHSFSYFLDNFKYVHIHCFFQNISMWDVSE